MKVLESLRYKLNKNAELSGQEKKTNKIINAFLEKTNPDIHLRNERKYSLYYILLIYKDDSIYLLFNGTKNIKKMIK